MAPMALSIPTNQNRIKTPLPPFQPMGRIEIPIPFSVGMLFVLGLISVLLGITIWDYTDPEIMGHCTGMVWVAVSDLSFMVLIMINFILLIIKEVTFIDERDCPSVGLCLLVASAVLVVMEGIFIMGNYSDSKCDSAIRNTIGNNGLMHSYRAMFGMGIFCMIKNGICCWIGLMIGTA